VLEFLARKPNDPEDGSPVLVLLHGRGSHMGDLQGLARVLPEGGTLVTPQAPHPGGPWGYGPGWAWYRYLGGDRVDAAPLTESLRALDGLLGALPERLGFRPGSVVLGGFSQGGSTSLAYALTRPGSVAGAVVLSGFLVNEAILGVGPEALRDTPLFWGHGTEDPAVPHGLALEGRARLAEAGADLEAHDYRVGHGVAPQEVSDLSAWLNRILSRSPRSPTSGSPPPTAGGG
jgi:phospholipase/carboxylesterase